MPSPMLDDVSRTLIGLRSEMLGAETHGLDDVADLSEDTRASARNLLHYLALRRHDLRTLQRQLEGLGLSSLDGAESRVLGRIDAVLSVVQQLDAGAASGHANVDVGRALLQAHADALFGPPPRGRDVRIMVTMPPEAARDYALVRNLLRAGMDCMRINCAHDDRDACDEETKDGAHHRLT